MNKVLDGKLDVIAYLPLKNFKEKICGRPDYTIEDLKKIVQFGEDVDEDDDEAENEDERIPEQEKWYWEILGEFDQK